MRFIRALIFVLLGFGFYSSQTVSLQWAGNTTVDYGTVSYTLPFFTNKNYTLVHGVPHLSYTIPQSGNEGYEIKNLQWERVSARDLADLKTENVPDQEIAHTQTQTVQGQTFTNVVVAAFRKNKSDLYRLLSFELKKQRLAPSSLAQRTTSFGGTVDNPLKTGTFYKIRVDKSGIFKITAKFLRDNGINPSGINPKNFRVYGNGGLMLPEDNRDFRHSSLQETAIQVVGEEDGKWDDGDYALFYAQGPHGYNLYNRNNGYKRRDSRLYHKSENTINIYEDFAYYFINFDKGPGKRTGVSDLAAPVNPFTRYDDYQFINEEKVNLLNIGRLWVGDPFNSSRSITFNLRSPIQPLDEIYVKTAVMVRNANQDRITFSINDRNSRLFNVSNSNTEKITRVEWEDTAKGFSGNTLKIDYTLNSGNPLVTYNLDFVEVQYKEDLRFNDSQMNFRVFDIVEGSGISYGFLMNNTSNPDQVWDVSDVTNAKRMVNKSTASNQFLFSYTASQPLFNNEFVAFKTSAAFEPRFVERVENQDLASLQNVDYLVITTREFMAQGERMANYYRTQKNFRTEVVDAGKIYNEFSSGSKDITAIRDFITKLNTPSGSLKYVLILGDSSFDFRNRTTNNRNLIPSYQSEYSEDFENSFVTDDYFVMISPQQSTSLFALTPDLPIGRLPAQNLEEARLLVDKTLAYYNALPGQSTPFGDWRLKMNFVVDDYDSNLKINFHDIVEPILASNFESAEGKKEYHIKKLYLDAYPSQSTPGGQRYPLLNQAIANAMINSLYINYFGHGGVNGWADERVLTVENISGFKNYNNTYTRFPFVSTITCEFTLWDDHNTFSAGEQLLKLPQGGAHAMLTSSRAIFTSYGIAFSRILTDNLFKLNARGGFENIGDAFLQAKMEHGRDPDHLKINLLGDPAMAFSRPKNRISIDRIESPVNSQLRALDFVKISGEIKNDGGTRDTSFNGRIIINIYDKKLNKKTLNNDGSAVPALGYLEEGSPIVKASGTVVNGTFTVEFFVPKDINYNVGNGRILAYADNKVLDVFTNLPYKIGDINPNGINDNQPPKVQLYLNNTNFADGGITNTSPNLLACLTDDTGINSTGAGIGHDITVVLDGEVVNTTVVNDFFSPGPGNGCINPDLKDHQKGSVLYPFKNLKPGPHQLSFKVWDINNNSTTQTLNFTVRDAEQENLVINRLLNWPNPFTHKTYVQFEHNCDDILEVNVQIYTLTGKLVKTISQPVSSAPYMQGYRTGKTDVEWDGMDDYGAPVGKGTYLYKVLVKSQNQEKCKGSASAVEKLVILK